MPHNVGMVSFGKFPVRCADLFSFSTSGYLQNFVRISAVSINNTKEKKSEFIRNKQRCTQDHSKKSRKCGSLFGLIGTPERTQFHPMLLRMAS